MIVHLNQDYGLQKTDIEFGFEVFENIRLSLNYFNLSKLVKVTLQCHSIVNVTVKLLDRYVTRYGLKLFFY